jgi:hypothetical protein
MAELRCYRRWCTAAVCVIDGGAEVVRAVVHGGGVCDRWRSIGGTGGGAQWRGTAATPGYRLAPTMTTAPMNQD